MTKISKQATIPVTINKAHLLTLGEKMYVRSIELLRELVNNAYDADATEVYVTVSTEKIEVEDNGSGMNEKGLEQYFNIGSPEKRRHSLSPRFGRKRIGEFGIGKFAALAVADCFTVETLRGKYIYKVIFNKNDWQADGDWQLPIKKELASPLDLQGTRVILTHLHKKINANETKNYLASAVPLRAKRFAVFVNNQKLNPRIVVGKHYPVNIFTLYGKITGEIVVALTSAGISEAGVECRVKGVLISRELFGFESSHSYGLNRISGYVEADFLPLTSNRSNFTRDSKEFLLFFKLVKNELGKVLKELKIQRDEKDLKIVSQTLKDVLSSLRQAFKDNPELIPSTQAITRAKKRSHLLAESINIPPDTKRPVPDGALVNKQNKPSQNKKEKLEVDKTLTKRIRIQKLGVNCALVYLGEEMPEVVSDSSFIYINQDHSLYKKYSQNKDEQFMYLLRLITQEIALMRKSRQTPRECFEYQNQLIRDAIK